MRSPDLAKNIESSYEILSIDGEILHKRGRYPWLTNIKQLFTFRLVNL